MQDKTLRVIINADRSLNLDPGQISALDVIKLSDGRFHILHQGRKMEAELLEADIQAKQFRIRIEGKIHHLRLEDQYDAIVKTMGMSAGQRRLTDIKAPMPGLVKEIFIGPGEAFAAGQNLLVLEAMKMENVLKAPAAGLVKAVPVEAGQAVDKGTILLELE